MGRRIVIVLAVVVGLAAVGWGAWAWHRSTIEVSTDDAYVEGMISPVSAKVSGHVVELLVDDNTGRPRRRGAAAGGPAGLRSQA